MGIKKANQEYDMDPKSGQYPGLPPQTLTSADSALLLIISLH
jgi:hypothetical protein